MAIFSTSQNFGTTGGAAVYRLDLTVTTTAVAGGTQAAISATATQIRFDPSITPAFSSSGSKSYSTPSGRVTSTSGSFATSGTATWSYNFGSSSTQYVWAFNRFYSYSAGSSASISLTAAGSGSSFLQSTTATVDIDLFAEPTPQVTVPNVVGLSPTAANTAIQNAGLVAQNNGTSTSGATAANDGTVRSQSPSAGSSVNDGSTVTYLVYSYTPPAPTAPTSLSATTTRTDGIRLTYSGATGTITNYGIWWNSVANQGPTSGNSADFTDTASPYTDTTPSTGETRYYWIRSQGPGGNSAWFPSGNGIEGTRLALPEAPGIPANFDSDNIGQTSITVSWSAVTGATGYELFLNGISQGTRTTTSYTYSGLTTDTTYTLAVRAYATNAAGTTNGSSTSISRTTLPSTFSTPNVVSQPRDTAINTLETSGFSSVSVFETTTSATSFNNRRVITQVPTAGTLAEVGSTASIEIYDYRLQVPNILGLTENEANTALGSAGFASRSSSLTTAGATVENNLKVGSQTPTGGSQFNPLDTVTFSVFNFLTSVPNVIGQTLGNAITNLTALGFASISSTLDEVGATVENVGTVKSQTPTNSGTTYNPANQSVSLVVYSLGVTGRRNTGETMQPLTNARRFDGTDWTPISVAKRFDGSAWRDITN